MQQRPLHISRWSQKGRRRYKDGGMIYGQMRAEMKWILGIADNEQCKKGPWEI